MLKIGITGTDTGVGKTVVACGLISLLRFRSFKTGVMKPVETGVARGDAGSDHMLLAKAAGVDVANTDLCPVVLDLPLAPWIAAREADGGKGMIDIQLLDHAFARVSKGKDCVLVEGAGGLLVPLSRGLRFDGLFSRWDLDLLIVAADKLGAINHTLLTIEAAQKVGLRVRGVVLNQLQRVNPMPDGMANAAALRELVPEIPVLEFPCVDSLYGRPGIHAYGAPLDMELLRDTAQKAGLLRLLFGSDG